MTGYDLDGGGKIFRFFAASIWALGPTRSKCLLFRELCTNWWILSETCSWNASYIVQQIFTLDPRIRERKQNETNTAVHTRTWSVYVHVELNTNASYRNSTWSSELAVGCVKGVWLSSGAEKGPDQLWDRTKAPQVIYPRRKVLELQGKQDKAHRGGGASASTEHWAKSDSASTGCMQRWRWEVVMEPHKGRPTF
jgi:hypothetical protein